MIKKIKVAELFAGVGGFRIGLENYKGSIFDTIWNNQWEPSTKKQHASEVYVARFGPKGHSNVDIKNVLVSNIPDHDLLVGGFPCQDYSVARNLGQSGGITGRKGVLWWEIHRILDGKGKKAPLYLMLENVDRLLKSPSTQRGRDFAIMLSSLNKLSYIVEWRIVNAAEYGMPQRRKRIFIMGYKKGSRIYKKIVALKNSSEWLEKKGVTVEAFPIKKDVKFRDFKIEGTLEEITKNFNKEKPKISPFGNTGLAIVGKIITAEVKQDYDGKRVYLRDIILDEKLVPKEFFIDKKDLEKWKYLKGAKKEERVTKSGFTFSYNEGSMSYPDSLDKPSRTIITAEGGISPSRFKHVIKTKSGKLRRLTPLELERLCMFPDNHTEGQVDTRRAFFMGNALVVGVIEKLGKALANFI